MTPGRFFLAGLVLVALAQGAGTSVAVAANVSYVGADGNIWRMAPDGGLKEKLTTDGTAEHRYVTPSQEDDGTVVAIHKVAGTSNAFADFIRPTDKALIDSWSLPKSGVGSFVPLSGGEISPGGSAFIYDWHYFDCGSSPCSLDERTSVVAGPGITDPCLIICYSGYMRPRWIPGTDYAGYVNSGFDWVWVQNGSGLSSWLGFANSADGNVQSFDVASNGTSVIEVSPVGGHMSDFQFFNDNGTPPGGTPSLRCKLVEAASTPAYPRFSPDGSMIAWQSADGVHVSPAPTQTDGGACVIHDTLVASGAKEPAWGPATIKDPGPGPGPPGPGPGPEPNPNPNPNPNPGVARLKLVPKTRKVSFRPGRTVVFRVGVTATGGDARRLKVCTRLPKPLRKKVKLPGCRQIGLLRADQTTRFRFKVGTTRKASGQYGIKIVASAAGLDSRMTEVTLKSRKKRHDKGD